MNGRTRTGKIARLPYKIREELNQRLQDGEERMALAEWLNSLPEVQAVLKEHFGGRAVSEKNMSDWVLGGYRDWQLRQEALEAVKQMDTEAKGVDHASEQPIVDSLLKMLAARYAMAALALDRSDEHGELDVKLLHRLCYDMLSLHRSEQVARRVQMERERLDSEMEKNLKESRGDKLRWVWANCEDVLSHLVRQLRDCPELLPVEEYDDSGAPIVDKLVAQAEQVASLLRKLL